VILTHRQITHILADPARMAGLRPTEEERAGLADMGLRPFFDDLLEAYVTGQALDTSESDIHTAALQVILKAELAAEEE
jgi:hypothetical protein